MRTIRVTGKGQLRIKPDLTRITITLTGLYKEYGDTLRRSSEDTEALRRLISGFGFEKTDLKTLSFNIDSEYEGYDDNGVWRQRFSGYRFRHMMKLEFPSDNDRLGRILYALANCDISPEFRLSYTVKDPEAAKNELLGRAVADAADKAGVIARAAGVSLGNIQSIDYSWEQSDLEVRPVNRVMAAGAPMAKTAMADAAYEMNIEPDAIETSDTVTVVWEIA